MPDLNSLEAWKAAMDLAEVAYRLTETKPFECHWSMKHQIRRSASSIPANIAEGYGLGTRAQFRRCLRIALGSAYELNTHFELARRIGINEMRTTNCVQKTNRVIGLIVGLLKSLDAG